MSTSVLQGSKTRGGRQRRAQGTGRGKEPKNTFLHRMLEGRSLDKGPLQLLPSRAPVR